MNHLAINSQMIDENKWIVTFIVQMNQLVSNRRIWVERSEGLIQIISESR